MNKKQKNCLLSFLTLSSTVAYIIFSICLLNWVAVICWWKMLLTIPTIWFVGVLVLDGLIAPLDRRQSDLNRLKEKRKYKTSVRELRQAEESLEQALREHDE